MENEKKTSNNAESLKTIVELQRKIRQLEFVINHLQGRLGTIATSYELELAIAKSEIEMLKLYGDTDEEVD
jgi:hypothetical protein